jgi:small subunit ribosomal protein S6
MKQNYELMVVLNPALTKEDSGSAKERIKELMGKSGAEFLNEEGWGIRRLAYPIRKAGHTYLEGNYYLTKFKMERAAIKEVEGQLRISEQVLRHLLVKVEPPKPQPVKAAVAPAAAEAPAPVVEAPAPPNAEASEPAAAEVPETPEAEAKEPEEAKQQS